MEELRRRIALARRALATLREALAAPKTAITRDAAIQRFEELMESWLSAMERRGGTR